MLLTRRNFAGAAAGAGLLAASAASASTSPLTLAASMDLAGRHLLTFLDPSNNYLPYWSLKIGKEYKAAMNRYWPAHNLGRWWDAMMRLEATTGFAIPPPIERAMRENVRAFFDNPDCLPFLPANLAGKVQPSGEVELHSLREGLLALFALAHYRKDSWAADTGHKMLETVSKAWKPDGGWELSKLEAYRRLQKATPRHMDPTATHGRLIEAMLWFYETTRDPLALTLADRFARFHLANSTNVDGTLNRASNPDHTHSYLGTLRGLLLFGEITNQREYIDRVAATYRATIFGRLIKNSGYIAHDLTTEGTAEPTSVGDIAQLGLWLSRHGYPEFLDDCERLVRCRLLPSQIVTAPDVKPLADDGDDRHRDLGARFVGAYGGMHQAHWGKNAVTDITCAVVHTLLDVYQHIAVKGAAGLTVNFHLAYEGRDVRVTGQRAADAALIIEPRVRENLLVRIPRWTPPESVKVSVNGTPFEYTRLGNYALIPRDALPGKVVMRYALPVRTEVETTAGVAYTFKWRGDEIVGMAPNNDLFPFYPALS